MRHLESFSIECQAYITHRDDMTVMHISEPTQQPWRACVRTVRGMEWQRCSTQQEAREWIDSWKRKLELLQDEK